MKSGVYYKIGISNNPKSRMSAIKTSSPLGVNLIGYKSFKDDLKKEKELHRKYSSSRVSGEWFILSDKDLNEICEELCITYDHKKDEDDDFTMRKLKKSLEELNSKNEFIEKLSLECNSLKRELNNTKQEKLPSSFILLSDLVEIAYKEGKNVDWITILNNCPDYYKKNIEGKTYIDRLYGFGVCDVSDNILEKKEKNKVERNNNFNEFKNHIDRIINDQNTRIENLENKQKILLDNLHSHEWMSINKYKNNAKTKRINKKTNNWLTLGVPIFLLFSSLFASYFTGVYHKLFNL